MRILLVKGIIMVVPSSSRVTKPLGQDGIMVIEPVKAKPWAVVMERLRRDDNF